MLLMLIIHMSQNIGSQLHDHNMQHSLPLFYWLMHNLILKYMFWLRLEKYEYLLRQSIRIINVYTIT